MCTATARGQIILNHPPHPSGGPGADTSFYAEFSGTPTWQLLADDFVLQSPASTAMIRWYGFYGGCYQSHLPPPGDESFRIRFYEPRPDGLPGAILYEETFLNPPRSATGNFVYGCALSNQYLYQADLSRPFQLSAGQRYWLEIVQLGDINSHFRWQYSLAEETGHAYLNRNVPDWRVTQYSADLTFQLWAVPEPATIMLVSFALPYILRRGRKERGFKS